MTVTSWVDDAWIRTRFPRWFAASLLMLAACAGNDSDSAKADSAPASPSAGAAASIDPCALVTATEAAGALGVASATPERPVEANNPPALATCRYTAPQGQGVAVMTVMARVGTDAAETRIGFSSMREGLGTVTPVTGLGEEGFWIGDQLHVRRGAVHLNINGIAQAKAETLMRTALGRLP